MTAFSVNRTRTALSRRVLSRPFRIALQDGLVDVKKSVFDYGCGRGDDLRNLREIGIKCDGWDPNHRPDGVMQPADVVNLGYVINVVEDADERAATLRRAWELTKGMLIVAARLSTEAKGIRLSPFEDGYLTRRSTFQKYYDQHELRAWIDELLGESSVPAGPGIFYVFRDLGVRESFVASRYRRTAPVLRQRRVDKLFEQNRELFEPLIIFFGQRGRLPDESELQNAEEIREQVGSIKSAFNVIRRVVGAGHWEQVAAERSQDLLVYLALSRFSGRPRVSSLPRDIQLDIRAFFSTYSNACVLADRLLFSAGDSNAIRQACLQSLVGKLTPGSLYVHVSALQRLQPILRVYEGCARAYIGSVEGANIIKLKYLWPQVSYLAYPDFDTDPHPALFASMVIPLRPPHMKYREYRDSSNPPILHRKETFLAEDYPLRDKFSRLTRQEERRGLYDNTHVIGTRNGWEAVLKERRLALRGHQLIRLKALADAT